MSKLQTYLDNMVSIFDKRSKDFTYTNIYDEEMPMNDYLDESIPKDRVESDVEQLVEILREAENNLSQDEFLVLVAAYCNYYIKEGIMLRINQEYWGLEDFFSTRDDKDVVFLTCEGVIRQDYTIFEKILELNEKCTVANVYLFVKYMSEVTYLISIGDTSVENVEKLAWGYYEQLDEFWKKYVIQEKKYHPYEDKSPIPYIYCGMKVDDMLIEYTKSILEKLDIHEFESENLYNLIQEKYHVMSSCEPLFNLVLQNEINKDKSQDFIMERICKTFLTMSKEIEKGLKNRNNTLMDMTFLFEKLGDLVQMTEQDRKDQCRFEILDFPEKEDSLAYRYEYVHIPMVTSESISMKQLIDRYRLFSINRELENKIATLNQMNFQRIKMVNQLEHSWGNESYPEIVKDVADSLNRQNENNLANKLFMAYESETMMMGQIIILQALMSDDPESLKKSFRDSFFESSVDKIGYKIDEIFSGNLNRLISNLIYSNENNTKKKKSCRKKLSTKYNREDIKKRYSEFLTNKSNISIFDWFNDNVFNMKFTVDEEWMKVNFGLTPNGRIIFENILTEIFTNILFHGKEYCNINLFYEDEKYKIEISNGIDHEEHGSQNGLEAVSSLIDKLNFKTNILEKEGLVCKNENEDCFVTTITLAKELMYLEGWVL